MTIVLDLPAVDADTDLSSFLPYVVPYAHDVPEFVAVRAIRDACIEFCDKTLYWVYEHPAIPLIDATSTYALTLPTGSVTARILDGWVGNMKLTPKSEDQLRANFLLDWRNIPGRPQYVTQLNTLSVTVAPFMPEALGNELNLIVALRPKRDSDTIGTDVYERWAEQISYGARSRLYATAGQPYSDAEMAGLYRGKFIVGIGEAKIERNRGLTRATLSVRPPVAI